MMKWRFVDRVDRFESWVMIRGRKCVSLEEYDLTVPLGRKGALPESLVIESAVHLARWLAMKSSDFRLQCLLEEISDLTFEQEAGVGATLDTAIQVRQRDERSFTVHCESRSGAALVCRGTLTFHLVPLDEWMDRENTRLMWEELYAQAS